MALDARHRSSLYLKLVPLLGEDDANALMSEFPASEAVELVTKQFLRAELALMRGELREELAGVRGELREELAGVRGELREELAGVRGELRDETASIRAEMAALESRLTVRIGGAVAASTAFLTAVLGTLITLQ